MKTGTIRGTARGEHGFTLVELLVAMAVTIIVLGGTLVAMTNAFRASESAKGTTGMNSNLRVGMDMMVRDFIQTGQGLPVGRVVSVPNGDGATPIVRPGPPGTAYTFDPNEPVLSAVTPGPELGPQINDQPTDMVTILAADSAFENVCLSSLAAGAMTVGAGVDITDGGPDDVRDGDLIMLTKGTFSALMYVTSTSGQTVTFGTGDPLNLNQFDPSLDMLGTLDQLRAAAPPDTPAACPAGVPTRATRVRMISYYIDATTDPDNPRLVRRMNADPGRVVAFSVEGLQLSYDLADGATNPTGVRMDDDDLDGGGACSPSECSPNQVRKVNVLIAGRSRNRFSVTGDFLRNSLASQVSLRSLAFVDRYR
jgi:prepilin-type N-terminal cleavage/methylation domain-containing protein